MKRTLIGILLTVSLVAGLLPTNAKAATVSASVTLAGQTLTVSTYDTPAYSVNADTEITDTAGNKFTAITQALGSDAEKWNAKFVWHAGDAFPTLYLKGFIVDEYNEENAKWKDTTTTAISIPAGQPMRIIIGENSHIKTRFGITYKSNLEILSEGKAKLGIWNMSTAISSGTATGCALSIDANLDLFVKSYYDTSSHILQTNKADLTINGGNIKVSTDDEKSLFGIITRNSGNIIINGGNLEVTSSIGAAPSNGSIHSSDKIIINGGTVKATAKSSVPLYAKKGIEINAGLVDITGPYYGISAGTPDSPADIAIKGGTVKIAANRAFFTYPILGEGVFAYAGADEASAKIYNGSITALAKEPWMLIFNAPTLQKETEPTQAPSSTPTELTTATVAPSIAPTTLPTTGPTAAPTEATTPAPDKDTTILTGSHLLLWLATAGAMGLVGIVITLIIFRRKK